MKEQNIKCIISGSMFWWAKDFRLDPIITTLYRDEMEVGYCLTSQLIDLGDGFHRVEQIFDDYVDIEK